MATVPLRCECGAVQGSAVDISPSTNIRVLCCCDDCQAFADFLDKREQILDKFGGTDLLQTNQAQISIDTGREHLRAMRLRPKGLLRWYTGCCNTPVALLLNARMPFVSVVHSFIDARDLDATIGPRADAIIRLAGIAALEATPDGRLPLTDFDVTRHLFRDGSRERVRAGQAEDHRRGGHHQEGSTEG